jgi:hypothetical protein
MQWLDRGLCRMCRYFLGMIVESHDNPIKVAGLPESVPTYDLNRISSLNNSASASGGNASICNHTKTACVTSLLSDDVLFLIVAISSLALK